MVNWCYLTTFKFFGGGGGRRNPMEAQHSDQFQGLDRRLKIKDKKAKDVPVKMRLRCIGQSGRKG